MTLNLDVELALGHQRAEDAAIIESLIANLIELDPD